MRTGFSTNPPPFPAVSPERFRRLRNLFDAAVGLPPPEWRSTLLAIAPDDAAGLRAAILALIAGRGALPRRGEEELERFGRPGLARKLAGLMDRLAPQGG